jgi:exosortase O
MTRRITQSGLNLVVFGLWLWLYRPVFDYFSIIFTREDFRTNQWALAGVIGLIVWQARHACLRPRLDAAPRWHFPALALALGGSMLYLAVERWLGINTVSASLFGLASYGLLGLWMEPNRWRQGVPAALLLIGVLPFGDHLQTFVGYPMRITSAAIVRDGLHAIGISSVGIDTILVLENGVSQVDLPCSGVKSLWTGLLFLIGATWIERRRLNLRWLLVACVFALLLFAANVMRVGVLVVVGQVLNWGLAARMIHVPLGVLAFVAACAATVWMLRRIDPLSNFSSEQGDEHLFSPQRRRERRVPLKNLGVSAVNTWPSLLLASCILLLASAYVPRPHTGLAQPPPGWEFSPELRAEPLPLKPDEVEWLTRDGAGSADRWRFRWRGVTGSMILIASDTWRAQHRPERCFEVYGLSLEESSAYLVRADFPLRFVSLGDGRGRGALSAVYWFQSAGRTTDDYGARMWADLAPERERWVLVTVLFDRWRAPQDADVQEFYGALHDAVQHSLEGRGTTWASK